jgi:hypothetical protein
MSATELVRVTPVTLSLDTSAYADGDLLAATQAVPNFFAQINGACALHSLVILDEDDQGAAIDLLFLDANEDLGTENGAYALSDAEARSILYMQRVLSGDWIDLGGQRIAQFTNIGATLRAAADTATLYVAAISRGTPTYTASGLKLRIGTL